MPFQTMTAVTTAGTERSSASTVNSALPTWAWAVLLALCGVLYLRVATKLALDWYTFPDYAHGFLIPFFCMYVVWEKRETIRNTPM